MTDIEDAKFWLHHYSLWRSSFWRFMRAGIAALVICLMGMIGEGWLHHNFKPLVFIAGLAFVLVHLAAAWCHFRAWRAHRFFMLGVRRVSRDDPQAAIDLLTKAQAAMGRAD